MVESHIQLVDRVRSEGVAHIRAVEGDTDGADVVGAVISDVGEVEPGYLAPGGRVIDLRNHEPRG
jgi:hypothetical protein